MFCNYLHEALKLRVSCQLHYGCEALYASLFLISLDSKQLLDEVEHDIMNYQNRGLRYLPQPSASADNTDTRF